MCARVWGLFVPFQCGAASCFRNASSPPSPRCWAFSMLEAGGGSFQSHFSKILQRKAQALASQGWFPDLGSPLIPWKSSKGQWPLPWHPCAELLPLVPFHGGRVVRMDSCPAGLLGMRRNLSYSIPALQRLRQEDGQLEANLGYIVSPVWKKKKDPISRNILTQLTFSLLVFKGRFKTRDNSPCTLSESLGSAIYFRVWTWNTALSDKTRRAAQLPKLPLLGLWLHTTSLENSLALSRKVTGMHSRTQQLHSLERLKSTIAQIQDDLSNALHNSPKLEMTHHHQQ
jgi:hypothetical protein